MQFYTDPLLKTTEILNALFHNSAVVCEGDTDKVFYSEINRRLLSSQEGIQDTIFLNAQNKQTIHRVVAPLRKAGIPAAGIFDLDVFNKQNLKHEEGTLWEKILNSLNVPPNITDSLEEERAKLEISAREFTSTEDKPDKNPFSKLEVQSLAPTTELYIGINSIIDTVKQYGMFIVPVGELEDWFANKAIQDATGIWLVDVLQHMENAQFKPGNDEIWNFVRLVNEWISNPKRLGMPS